MRQLILSFLILISFGFAGCASSGISTTPTSNTPSTVAADIQAALPLITTSATVATGAVLQFVETNATSRTALANEIYASANALNSLSTGAIPTPAQIQATVMSFGGSSTDASYASYATALSALYSSYYAKLTASGNSQLAVQVLQAIAVGASTAASVYVTLPAPVAS